MEFVNSDATIATVATFQMLPPLFIVSSANMRRTVLPEELRDLQESINSLRQIGEGIEGSGILQALLVRPLVAQEGDRSSPPSGEPQPAQTTATLTRFQLICGQKRFLAAKALQLPVVPCLIDHRDPEEIAKNGHGSVAALSRLLQLTENAQRSDPPPLEEAEALLATMKELRLSVRDAARLLGKNKGYIENRLRLLKMAPDVQRMVSLRKDTIPHAYYLNQISDEQLRVQLISAVLHEQISVREVRRRIELETEVLLAFEANNENRQLETARPQEKEPTLKTFNSEFSDTFRRDYVRQNLQPAVSLVAQVTRHIDPSQITEKQRKHLRVELDLLRRQIDALESCLSAS